MGKMMGSFLMGFALALFIYLVSQLINIVWLRLLIIAVTSGLAGALIAYMEDK